MLVKAANELQKLDLYFKCGRSKRKQMAAYLYNYSVNLVVWSHGDLW